jgi:GT2 family glycosyltransferase
MGGAADLTVVVVSYGTRDLTLACLRSLFRETVDTKLQVIVVDNGSDDGSPEAIRAELPQVTLIALDENLGFARANNLGASQAEGDWLLLLNSDTVVLDRAIDRLIQFARSHPESGIFGGRTVFQNGTLNPSSCWARPTPLSVLITSLGLHRFVDPESYRAWKRDSIRSVDIVSGCFMLLRRDHWARLGGFDSRFFMYGEDADLCLRARELGLVCTIYPKAQIIHHGGRSERAKTEKMVRLFKSKALLYRKHWHRRSARLAIRLLDLWAVLRMTGYWLLRKRDLHATWRTIWQRRMEWHIHGLSPVGEQR